MKRLFTLLITLVIGNIVIVAQPTLTSANYVPTIGDSQFYYVADTNSVLDPTVGANVIFNYSGLRGYGGTQTQYVVDPTTTTYASDFPTATYADTTGGFPVNKNYKKVEATDSLTNIGLVADVSTYGTVVAKYNIDPETLMKFPFNFNDNYADNYSGVFTVQGVNTNGNGNATVNADAWGTLIFPLGVSIDSVIRVKTIEHLETDTIVIPFPPITILPVVIDAEYVNYYKPSLSKFPLLSFINGTYTQDNNTLDSTTVVISQYPMPGVGIDEIGKEIDMELFPNPTKNNDVTLSFKMENNKNITIDILNNIGQKIRSVYNGNIAKGEQKITIKTNDLSKGLYFVNVNIDGQNVAKKLMVE